MSPSIIFAFLFAISFNISQGVKLRRWYKPEWKSLNARPIPSWIFEAKIGIRITWGIYSVPSCGCEYFWWHLKMNEPEYMDFVEKNCSPGFSYADFALQFTTEFFDANEWVDEFKKSGAKFVTLTAKHGDGFTMWPSNHSPKWNAMDIGPRRDLVGELADAVKNAELKFGLEYHLSEYFDEWFNADEASGFNSSNFVEYKIIPELKEIVEKYKPDILFTYDPGTAPSTYWKSKEFLTWLFNKSPVRNTVVVNNLWERASCSTDKWYVHIPLDKKANVYRKNASLEDILTTKETIINIIQVISANGIVTLNIGATKEGTILPIFQEILHELGEWLNVNGEAIYGTKSWTHQKDEINDDTYYTTKNNSVYAITTEWPEGNKLILKYPTKLFFKSTIKATLLGFNGDVLNWEIADDNTIILYLPDISEVKTNWVYVVKIQS